jgi:hypothetical protein
VLVEVTQGVAGGAQVTDETGMTPIPRWKFKLVSSAAAGSENTRKIVHANAFFIMALPYNSVLLDAPNEVAAKL